MLSSVFPTCFPCFFLVKVSKPIMFYTTFVGLGTVMVLQTTMVTLKCDGVRWSALVNTLKCDGNIVTLTCWYLRWSAMVVTLKCDGGSVRDGLTIKLTLMKLCDGLFQLNAMVWSKNSIEWGVVKWLAF